MHIVSAAVKNTETGRVYTGMRHMKIIAKMKAEKAFSPAKAVEGFVTDEGKFVDRAEGARIAFQAKQIPKQKCHLSSEDLY